MPTLTKMSRMTSIAEPLVGFSPKPVRRSRNACVENLGETHTPTSQPGPGARLGSRKSQKPQPKARRR